jgi:hypothetical protein
VGIQQRHREDAQVERDGRVGLRQWLRGRRRREFQIKTSTSRISDQDFYQSKKPTNYSVGPMGGPCYRPWDFEAKVRPPEDELAKHLEYLSANWADVAGSSLAPVTRPLAFTGKQARRLLVGAKITAAPPWGGWMYR